jgi:hypothetical protein
VHVGFEDVAQVVVACGHVQAQGTCDLAVGRRHDRISRGNERRQEGLVGGRALVDEGQE